MKHKIYCTLSALSFILILAVASSLDCETLNLGQAYILGIIGLAGFAVFAWMARKEGTNK